MTDTGRMVANATELEDEEDDLWRSSTPPPPGYWEAAAELALSPDSSPVKEGESPYATVHETPTTVRLASSIEASLILDSGGRRSSKHLGVHESTSPLEYDPFQAAEPETMPLHALTRNDANFSTSPDVNSNFIFPRPQTRTPSALTQKFMAVATSRLDTSGGSTMASQSLAQAGSSSTDRVLGSFSTSGTSAAFKLGMDSLQKLLSEQQFASAVTPGKMAQKARHDEPYLELHDSKPYPLEMSDSESRDIDEVDEMMDTDTETSEANFSQKSSNSLFDFEGPYSRVTSTTTLTTRGSFTPDSHDLSRGHKRSFDDIGPVTSEVHSNSSPSKSRRTTYSSPTLSGKQTTILHGLTRSATYPTIPPATSPNIYPNLDHDLEARPSKSSSNICSKTINDLSATNQPTSERPSQNVPSIFSPTKPSPAAAVLAQKPQQLSISGAVSPEIDLSLFDEIEDTANITSLPPLEVITLDIQVQRTMDDMRIPWGVQWEIARGVTFHNKQDQPEPQWGWADVTRDKLYKIKGGSTGHVTNAETAWKVRYVMKNISLPSEQTSQEIWCELDREQNALQEGKGRGLGLMGEHKGIRNWYGGQIQQICRLKKGPAGFTVTLEPLEKNRSHRFGRYLGSRRLLQMRIDTELLHKEREEVTLFLARDFVLCGRVFRPFTSKEDSLYMVEITRNYGRLPRKSEGDHLRISYGDFLRWHNPWERNCGQAISKWAARWQIGLSTSRPVLLLEESNIEIIDDVYSPDAKSREKVPVEMIMTDAKSREKVPAEMIMTDGCGFINEAGLTKIFQSGVINLGQRPDSIQFRLLGAKGMLLRHPIDKSEEPKVWIRLSQKKISLPTPLGRAHRILELICPSRVVTPSHLNTDAILNLSHNGVPTESISRLFGEHFKNNIEPLKGWGSFNAMVILAHEIYHLGRIGGLRLQRMAPGNTRALGLAKDFHREEQLDADTGKDLQLPERLQPIYSGRCVFSGAPMSIHEGALELLLAGFQPEKLEFLYKKIHSITKLAIDAAAKDFRIAIPQSLEAFILPDPTGELEEGQIYFCSSSSLIDPETGTVFTTILGDVIVGRNPNGLPSDLQKVTAVDCPALRGYYDVVIFPIKGKRSLASFLAGGDYDGDTIMLFWAKWLVEHFQNSPISEPPPSLLEDMFIRDVQFVTKFSKRLEGKPLAEAHAELQKLALAGLVDSKIGQLATYHRNAIYMYGYGAEQTQYIAHVFNAAMDSQKSGLRLNQEAFKKLKIAYDGDPPSYMARTATDYTAYGGLKIAPERTGKSLQRSLETPFVLQELADVGKRLGDEHLAEFEKPVKDKCWRKDADLLRPWTACREWASGAAARGKNDCAEDLVTIESFIQALYDDWAKKPQFDVNASPSKRPRGKRQDSKKSSSSQTAEFASRYAKGPDGHPEMLIPNCTLAWAKASCAYKIGSELFAFSVAFRDLCDIKVKSTGSYVPTTGLMAEAMSIRNSFKRVLEELPNDF